MWLARTCLAGLLLADISFGHPAPGLSGRHLVLLAGSVLAALTWIAWLPTERVSAWIRVPVLIAGMVGACLAALVSPGTAAAVLPLVIGVMAGSSYSVLEGAWAAACGLVTLGTG